MPGYHMSPEEFRVHGHAMVDWIAEYLSNLEHYPVSSVVAPGQVRAGLPEHPPEHGESFDAMMSDVDRIILPGIAHWQSPGFFAYFNANSSCPSILGDLLCAGLGVQGMMWSTSPACTELETLVLDWLVEMLGLPNHFHSSTAGGGVIQDSASGATLCAILAARERATGFRSDQEGVRQPITVYASAQAHSSVEKAVRIAGIGRENLRLVDSDARFAMRPEHLAERVKVDRAAGHLPACVVASVGTTSTHGLDPLPAIGRLCQAQGLWLHVDAAHAGTAALCPELRWIQDGLEWADSYCFNPHKWMFTGFDCDAFFVKDRATLVRALSVLPEYLRNRATESGAVIDYRDWHVPLGRRFRALKLWFVIRHYGVEGLRHHVREHVAWGHWLADEIRSHPDFEVVAPVPLNLVCFRHRAGDARNQAIMDRVNRGGDCFLTHTRLGGMLTLRLCVGGTWTRRSDVERVWQRILEASKEKGDYARAI